MNKCHIGLLTLFKGSLFTFMLLHFISEHPGLGLDFILVIVSALLTGAIAVMYLILRMVDKSE